MLFDIETNIEASFFKDNKGKQLFNGELLKVKYNNNNYLGELIYNGNYFTIKIYGYDDGMQLLYVEGYIDLRQYYNIIEFCTVSALDFVESLGINSYNTNLGAYQIYNDNIG